MYFHFHYLKINFGDSVRPFETVLNFFPGVPIFFVISGFLISVSFERRRDLRSYFQNRILRIYPALWVSFAVTLVLLGVLGFLGLSVVATPTFALWVAAQLSCFQLWSPEYFRTFGVGVVNGSLWTIPVEA